MRSLISVRFLAGTHLFSFTPAFDYALSLDMTRRKLRSEANRSCRSRGNGKAFEYSAPTAAIHTVDAIGHLDQGKVELKVNGGI